MLVIRGAVCTSVAATDSALQSQRMRAPSLKRFESFVDCRTPNADSFRCSLQGFCVPGSGTTLNVLAGCIFSDIVKGGEYWIAMPFAMVGATLGSTLCYLISYSTCTDFIQRRFPSQIEWLQKMILNQDSVFFCLL